ncbi:SAM-dependent methyltransferase [Streptomyces chrestomyceticus]|uniref:SAM-dependent methyltransferase n=1 Tax=Streptomyces chrestomyceticus TaxID=68185 RepID=UPI0036755A07
MSDQRANGPHLPDDWTDHPATARIDDWLTGGCENYEADRALAERLVRAAPGLPDMVAINRRHRPHAVTVLARPGDGELGITQFLDLGCGLPSQWNRKLQRHDPALTYEAARLVHPDARVAYVDHDPAVYAHARTELDTHPATTAVYADIRRMDELLASPGVQRLDRSRPIAVLLHDLLPWVSDHEAQQAMATLRAWLPDASALSVTHACTDLAPQTLADLAACYAEAGLVYRPRLREDIQALLGDWSLLPPGLVPTAQWRPLPPTASRRRPRAEHSFAYAAIATAPPRRHDPPSTGTDTVVAEPPFTAAPQAARRADARTDAD